MSDNYIMIPNNMVQNIKIDEVNKPSFIQLYGKRTVAYFKQLIELQNMKEDIHFSIDMILWLLNIKDNIKRERKYLKEFLVKIHNNSLIIFSGDVDISNISSSDFLVGKLNIYDYKKDKDKQQKINYFMLLDSEYNTIINYSGKLDKYNLLNLFCNIKSRIKKNSNDTLCSERLPEVAYPSYNTIMNDIFIESPKTLREYIDELVELDLIRFSYAGDMIMELTDEKPIRRKANFTYTLYRDGWEVELDSAISLFRSQKKMSGWQFITKDKEVAADEKRSITQKINMLEKLSKDKTLTQSQQKELKKLKKTQSAWKTDNDTDVRKLEEEKLLSENPDKELWEIYEDMGFEDKAERAYNENNL